MKATYYLALIAIIIMLFQFTSAAPKNPGDNEDLRDNENPGDNEDLSDNENLGDNEDLSDNENPGDNGAAKLRNERAKCNFFGVPINC